MDDCLLAADDPRADDAYSKLAAAIILQAVDDFRALERIGIIQRGQMQNDRMRQGIFGQARGGKSDKISRKEAQSVINFFHTTFFEMLALFAGARPEAVRWKLGIGENVWHCLPKLVLGRFRT